jgi:hypothetical protein
MENNNGEIYVPVPAPAPTLPTPAQDSATDAPIDPGGTGSTGSVTPDNDPSPSGESPSPTVPTTITTPQPIPTTPNPGDIDVSTDLFSEMIEDANTNFEDCPNSPGTGINEVTNPDFTNIGAGCDGSNYASDYTACPGLFKYMLDRIYAEDFNTLTGYLDDQGCKILDYTINNQGAMCSIGICNVDENEITDKTGGITPSLLLSYATAMSTICQYQGMANGITSAVNPTNRMTWIINMSTQGVLDVDPDPTNPSTKRRKLLNFSNRTLLHDQNYTLRSQAKRQKIISSSSAGFSRKFESFSRVSHGRRLHAFPNLDMSDIFQTVLGPAVQIWGEAIVPDLFFLPAPYTVVPVYMTVVFIAVSTRQALNNHVNANAIRNQGALALTAINFAANNGQTDVLVAPVSGGSARCSLGLLATTLQALSGITPTLQDLRNYPYLGKQDYDDITAINVTRDIIRAAMKIMSWYWGKTNNPDYMTAVLIASDTPLTDPNVQFEGLGMLSMDIQAINGNRG